MSDNLIEPPLHSASSSSFSEHMLSQQTPCRLLGCVPAPLRFMEPLEIPVVEFDGLELPESPDAGPPELDLDNLPPDLQALLIKEGGGCDGSSHSGFLSIPSDMQSFMICSRGPSRGSQVGPVNEASHESHQLGSVPPPPPPPPEYLGAHRVPPLSFEFRVDFEVLRRSDTLAAGLPLALQRSARKIEREAPYVAQVNSRTASGPSSLQASLSASGRLQALAARAASAAASATFGSFSGGSFSGIGSYGSYGSFAVRPPDDEPPVIERCESDEIDDMLKGTIKDDDVEQFLAPSRPPSGLLPQPSTCITHPPRGLVNLGNTCFLNAAVQALGHCTPLTAYLLQGLFVLDLNEANPLGTGCVLTMVFAALLHQMFSLRSTGCTPRCSPGLEAFGADLLWQAQASGDPPKPGDAGAPQRIPCNIITNSLTNNTLVIIMLIILIMIMIMNMIMIIMIILIMILMMIII